MCDNSEKHDHATGTVLRVANTIIDVQFPQEYTPHILNELKIIIPENHEGEREASLEVAQQLGDNIVRCIALESVEGIRRGLKVFDTGGPIKAPVGPNVLGRIFDALGKPIDGLGPVDAKEYWPIHRDPPPLTEQKIITDFLYYNHLILCNPGSLKLVQRVVKKVTVKRF